MAQLFFGAEETGLYCTEGEVKHTGDLLIRELILITQRDEQTIVLIKVFDGMLQMGAQLPRLESTGGIIKAWVGFRDFVDHIVTKVGEAAAQAGQSVVAKVCDDAIQPGPELLLSAKV